MAPAILSEVDMISVINPEIRVRVETIFDDVWDSVDEDERLDIEIDNITKDLSGDPNQAVIQIHNLNDDTINILASGGDPAIEIFYNQYGSTELVLCFAGEIVNCFSASESPGTVTNLICESQTSHSRDRYVKLNYESGTAWSLIISELTDAIGLPVQSCQIPDRSILSAVTLTGPAFLNLKELLEVAGMFAYIVDGVLYISSVFEPPDPTVVQITKAIMTEQPQPTSRRDVRDLWYTLSLNNAEAAAQANSFAVNNGKVKRLEKKKLLDINRALVQVDAVDTDIRGRSVSILGIPELQPDTVIQLEDDAGYYRIQRLYHRGDNHSGVEITFQADVFEGS
jgi:hypothetical protein